MLRSETADLSAIAQNSVRPPETPDAEGAAAAVASISATYSVSRIYPRTIASNWQNKSLRLLDSFLEEMRIQMMREVQQRSFDKEDSKENEKQRIGQGRNRRIRRTRIYYILRRFF